MAFETLILPPPSPLCTLCDLGNFALIEKMHHLLLILIGNWLYIYEINQLLLELVVGENLAKSHTFNSRSIA